MAETTREVCRKIVEQWRRKRAPAAEAATPQEPPIYPPWTEEDVRFLRRVRIEPWA